MAAAASDGEDRISALPDDALHHILSFLPSDDAVRTCVLAQRWRREVHALPACAPRIHRRRDWTPSTLTNFDNHFLLLRGAAVPVHECDIFFGKLDGDYEEERENFSDAYKHWLDGELNRAACLWISHAVANWQARVLRVHFHARRRLCLDDVPFASPLLTRVELTDAKILRCIDFSRCLALADLTMSHCKIYGDRISSASLAHLTIANCYFRFNSRTRISTPRLVSLQLSVSDGKAPLLDKMPLLVAAKVTLECSCYVAYDISRENNVCRHGKVGFDDGNRYCYSVDVDGSVFYPEDMASCDSCYSCYDGSSVVLQGLSEATDLELISHPRLFILRKDCKSLTTFAKLKTLLLNEWCMAVDFNPLIYILQCSPVLEKLTLQLGHCETSYPAIKTDESYNPKEQLFIVPKQLKIFEIRCVNKNELVEKLLLLLMSNGVHSEQIQIEHNFSPPELVTGYEINSDYGDW